MVKFFEKIEPELEEWAMKQAVFFTATAPLTGRHINVSPKGLPSSSFCILTPNLCAYVDATGSGAETISHVQENGRITIMFCSFDSSPRIMRFFCTGRVIEWNDPSFKDWLKRMKMEAFDGARAVIVLDVFKAQTSCGYAVPYLALKIDPRDPSSKKQIPYLADRHTLGHWASKRVAAGEMDDYRAEKNIKSLDGLPALRIARRHAGENLLIGDLKANIRRRDSLLRVLLVALLSSVLTAVSLYMMGLTTFKSPLLK